jgi:hypothetical protein
LQQGAAQPHPQLLLLHPHVDLSCPQLGQAHAGATTVGQLLQPESGQAAIELENEHVAIPTAIAAATVSFLIVIFYLLVFTRGLRLE